MKIYFGADHRGFELKEKLKYFVSESGYEVEDMGAHSYDKDDDYPDFAASVAKKISDDPVGAMGILICGSGVGMDIAANKFAGVRATLANSTDTVISGRNDDDINVISIAADFTGYENAKELVKTFLETPFAEEERFVRRIEKIG